MQIAPAFHCCCLHVANLSAHCLQWVSKDGETHIKEAQMKDFDLKKFAAEPQFVKQGFTVKNLVFTEMAPGLMNDYHPCPSVQFVVCVGGSWYASTPILLP